MVIEAADTENGAGMTSLIQDTSSPTTSPERINVPINKALT